MRSTQKMLLSLAATVLLLSGCGSSSSTPQPGVAAVLKETISGYLAALEAKDVGSAKSYLAEPDPTTLNGMSAFFTTFDSWDFDNVEITVVSQRGDEAEVQVERDVTTITDGEPTEEHMSETFDLVKLDGVWLISSASVLSATAPAEPTPTPVAALPESAPPDHFTTYTSKNGLFEIAYPSDWEVLIETEDGRALSVGVPKASGALFPALQVSAMGWPPAFERLDDYATKYSVHTAQTHEAYRLLSMTKTSLDSKPAILMDYQALRMVMPDPELRDKPFRFLILMVKENGTLWTITCSTLSTLFEEQESDLRQALYSFRTP